MADKDKYDEEEKQKSGSKGFGIIVVLIIVVIIVVGCLAAYKMVFIPYMKVKTQAAASAAAVQVNPEDPLGITKKKPEVAGAMVDIPTFVVNLADPTGSKYLKIALSLEIPSDNKQEKAEIVARMPKIKDAIITILSAKTLEEVSTPQGKISLKEELLRRINGILTSGKVMEVYVTDFVVQG